PWRGCWDASGRSAGTPAMSPLRRQIGSRAASYILSELWNQLRCDGAAQLAIHVDYPNALAHSLTHAALTRCCSDLVAHGGRVVAEFKEVESGKHNARPQLQAALKRCQQTRATLPVAKLDRLSRNAAFLLGLRDAGVSFICADMPNNLTIGVLAAVA